MGVFHSGMRLFTYCASQAPWEDVSYSTWSFLKLGEKEVDNQWAM